MTKNQSSVFRGLSYLVLAKEYFEDVARSNGMGVREKFKAYSGKLQWVLLDIKHRLDPDMQAAFSRELEKGDTMWTEAMLDKMADLSQQDRSAVEIFIDHLKKSKEK